MENWNTVSEALGGILSTGGKVFRWYNNNKNTIDEVVSVGKRIVKEKILSYSIPTPDPVSAEDIQQNRLNEKLLHDTQLSLREIDAAEAESLKEIHNMRVITGVAESLANREEFINKKVNAFTSEVTELKKYIADQTNVNGDNNVRMISGLNEVAKTVEALMNMEENQITDLAVKDVMGGVEQIAHDLLNSIPTLGAIVNAGWSTGKSIARVATGGMKLISPNLMHDIFAGLMKRLPHQVIHDSVKNKSGNKNSISSGLAKIPYDLDSISAIIKSTEKSVESAMKHHEIFLKLMKKDNYLADEILFLKPSLICHTLVNSCGDVFSFTQIDRDNMVVAILFVDLEHDRTGFCQLDLVNYNFVQSYLAAWRDFSTYLIRSQNANWNEIYGTSHMETDYKKYEYGMTRTGEIAHGHDFRHVYDRMKYVSITLRLSYVGAKSDIRRNLLDRVIHTVPY